MGISPSYIITRFAQSIFTGPVRPTPGTAKAYVNTKSPDADKGFDINEFLSRISRTRPNNPPISVRITNKARMESSNTEDSLTLVGINPGSVKDSGSQARFSPIEVLGRSSPYAIYSGGQARSVSVSFKIHRELFAYYQPFGDKATATFNSMMKQMNELNLMHKTNPNATTPQEAELLNYYATAYISRSELYNTSMAQLNQDTLEAYRNTLNWLRALQYPIYGNGGVIAPRVTMEIGKFLKITGYPQVGISYESIYSEGYPVVADIDITVTEVLQKALDQTAIYNKTGSVGMDFVEWKNNKQ